MYKRAIIEGQLRALHDFLSALPMYAGDVGVYLEVIDAAIEELFERRDADDIDDVGLSDFDPNAEEDEEEDEEEDA